VTLALWTVLPLALVHLWMWRRWRAGLGFQLLVDLVLLAVVGPAVLNGADLNPVRCLSGSAPFDRWQWSAVTQPQPTQSDLVLQFHPWWAEARHHLMRGELPLISEGIGGGLPLLANGQSGLAAPMNLPLWVLGPERGSTVMAFWKLELAALGAFLYLLIRWRLRWAAAALAGLAYGCGCYQVAWLLVPLAWVTALLPWLWWLVHRALDRGRGLVSSLGAGLLAGWLLGCGLHPETAAIAIGSSWMMALILHPRRWPRVALMVPLSLLVAVLLSWPTIGYIAGSARLQHSLDTRPNLRGLGLEVQLTAARQLLVPAVNGHPGRGDWRAPFPHAPAATGIGGAALAVLLAGAVRRRHRRLLLAALAALAVAAVLAYRVPPLDALLVRLPPFDRMTLPRFAALVPWGLALWAGLAVEGALAGRRRALGWRLAPAAGLAVVALCAAPWQLRTPDLALVGMSVVLAGGAAALVLRPRWLAAAVAVELSLLAIGINPVADVADRLPRPPLVDAIADRAVVDRGRVLGLGGVLPPNVASRFGLDDLRAFDPVRPAPFASFMALLGEPEPILGGPLDTAPARLCGAWSVRYLVTPPALEAPGWEPLWQDDSVALWRNSHWLPELRVVGHAVPVAGVSDRASVLALAENLDFRRAALVPPDAPPIEASQVAVEPLALDPAEVRARVSCDGPCLLVLARPWAPGWAAEVDGATARLVLTDVAGLGVAVAAGEHQVELRYNPWRW
jgi:hypothetical protein